MVNETKLVLQEPEFKEHHCALQRIFQNASAPVSPHIHQSGRARRPTRFSRTAGIGRSAWNQITVGFAAGPSRNCS